jgi:hypothetical protein
MKNAYKILVEKPEEKDHSEDLGVDRKIILEWILGIHLTQDRDQWRTLVNAAMNLRVP